MLGHQDEIATSYRKCCAEFREKLNIRLNEIYTNIHKVEYRGNVSINHDMYLEEAFNSLVNFERKLLQYIRIKQQYQSENKTLQMTIKHLQLNLQSKNVCISKLKDDIVSHYLQVEFLRKHNAKIEGDLHKNKEKLDQYEKSKEWLRQQIYSTHVNDEYGQEIVSHESKAKKVDISGNISNKQEEQLQCYSHEKQTTNQNGTIESPDEHIVELTKFHIKLIGAYHENKFLKKALQKMKNMSDREDRLNRLLNPSRDIISVTKFEKLQKELNDKLETTRKKEKIENEKISQLNSIIDCLKCRVLQSEFEKRNTELLLFKMYEYFMKLKSMHTKLRVMLNDKNHGMQYSTLSENLSSDGSERNTSCEEKKTFLDSTTVIQRLRLEKLQLETEHLEELGAFTEKFNKMQFILNDIKAVCDHTESIERIEPRAYPIDNDQILDENTKKMRLTRTRDSAKLYDKDPGNHQNTRNSPISSTSTHLNSSNEYDVPIGGLPNFSKISRYVLRRMRSIEEQYKRITSVCSENLNLLKELNEKALISEMRQMKILALVKEKQSMDQIKRFEKYKRCLLNTIRVYRRSCITQKQRNDELKELYIPIVLELKFLKKHFADLAKNSQGSPLIHHEYKSQNHFLTEAVERIETLTEKIKINVESRVHKSESSERFITSKGVTLPEVDRMEDQSNQEKSGETHYNHTGNQTRSPPTIRLLPGHPTERGIISNGNYNNIICTPQESNVTSSEFENLKREKTILQAALQHRDLILGKIFNSFKCKIEGMSTEINEKYFLQRLCNDLRTVIKIYGSQNRVMREALENNNICTKSVYIQRTLRRTSANNQEEHVRELLRQQKNFSGMKDTFNDINSHLESMKKDVSLIHNVINMR